MSHDLFLAALSRLPTAKEKENSLKELAVATEADRRATVEDVFWSVLSSKEFVFNH